MFSFVQERRRLKDPDLKAISVEDDPYRDLDEQELFDCLQFAFKREKDGKSTIVTLLIKLKVALPGFQYSISVDSNNVFTGTRLVFPMGCS